MARWFRNTLQHLLASVSFNSGPEEGQTVRSLMAEGNNDTMVLTSQYWVIVIMTLRYAVSRYGTNRRTRLPRTVIQKASMISQK